MIGFNRLALESKFQISDVISMSKTIFNLDDIPQANDLTKVGLTVVAVNDGASTFQEIAHAIGFVDRQARYYRKAAEILGLIDQVGRNKSTLTETGKIFVESVRQSKDVLKSIKPHLMTIPLLREVYERVSRSITVDEDDILECLIELSNVKKSNVTIVRRLSTFVSWLKQVGLLEEAEEGKSYKLIPIVIDGGASQKIAPDENLFLSSLTAYLHIPKKEEEINWESLLTEYKQQNSIKSKKLWLNEDLNRQRLARYLIGISSKEKIEIEDLDNQIENFSKIDLSHARLLIERNRSLRFVTKSIGAGGIELEKRIEEWLISNQQKFKRAHLLPGTSKNVDFYVEKLNLAIESKYSKTSGTKHGGAIHDIMEIAKAKNTLSNLLVGVAIAGDGFEDSFFESLKALFNEKILDFILTSSDIGNTSPNSIQRMVDFKKPISDQLTMSSSTEMSWSTPLTSEEQGLYDAAYWLKKYSAVSYISFPSRLQTWINQTPFAIECLRLILGWSETQMYNFVLSAVPEGVSMLRTGETSPELVSLLVTGMNSTIAEDELIEIETYFDANPTVNDFIAARIEAFDGVARKKKNTSKIFIEMCKSVSEWNVFDKTTNFSLAGETNIQSNFSVTDSNGQIKNVICKYYSGDGSVMSDLVKKLEALSSSPYAKDWIVIIDGAGWKKRSKDLRRLIAIGKETKFQLYNFKLWKQSFQKSA